MNFIQNLEQLVRYYALHMPLELFVFVGSFLEEIVSPIPSALIMGTAGALALMHHEPLWYLFWLAAIGNTGKLLGAWLYYLIGDKLEDLVMRRITNFFGVKHEEIENMGKRFVGHHWKDGGVLFLLRVIPMLPTTPVSIAAGIIKMDKRVFLIATYAGNFCKDIIYLYAGYAGLAKLHVLWKDLVPLRLGGDILVTVLILGFFFFLYLHRGAGHRFIIRIHNWFQKFLKKNK